ncbi:MAG: DUF721 domain-containing protein [Pyrinomonadaceae bacterium]|nr:DUF721 domain-containing protein [Pyrinomonadaceae bacterium]
MNELFAALPALLKQMPDNPEVREAVIFAAWKRAAGRQLSGHTRAKLLTGETLTVAVGDRTWKRQLESLSGELVYKINASLRGSYVTYIEFVIDPTAIKERASGAALAAAPDARDATVETAASAIGDESLREKFLNAAAATEARNKKYGR